MSRIDIARRVSNQAARLPVATAARYGTVEASADAGQQTTILLDGSSVPAYLVADVPVRRGDRVAVVSQGGTYTVVSLDGAGRTATNFLDFNEEDGLVVGNMTEEQLRGNIRLYVDEEEHPHVQLRNGDRSLADWHSDFGGFVEMDVDTSYMINSLGGIHSNVQMEAAQRFPYNGSPGLVVGGTHLWTGTQQGAGTVQLLDSFRKYAALTFVFNDGARSYAQTVVHPANVSSTSLCRTVADAQGQLYTASMMVSLSADGIGVTVERCTQLRLAEGSVTSNATDNLVLTGIIGWR